ncbi:MAG TPA: acetyl-CoA C-acyltransferase [Thermoanaerobaculia bacterium]|jgi:acetyl-CoA C-acetyltransferase|nr:acetyl-CoA C-acyltransferase [Thermoanaerobaculia bacterium]
MPDVVILSAARTPIGSFQGALASLPATALGSAALGGAITRAAVDLAAIEQVYMGCVLPAGLGQAPARQAALGAGCPPSTGAITLNKVCGSGMRAVMSAANDLRAGEFTLVAAGGMESMSNAPYLAAGARDGLRLGHGKLVDSMIHDGLWDPYGEKPMGACAEACVDKYQFSRQAQDEYARESYRRAREASEKGIVADEIVPVEVGGKKGATLVDRDEEPFRADLEKMGRLKPAFKPNGTITAANSSSINDGAAALVLTTAEHAARLGKRPIGRLLAQASFAQEPEWFTTAPITAMRRALERARLDITDVDLFEVNEAFAAVAMAAMHDLGILHDKLNVRGGAVALGHPIGASGARILVTLLHALAERGRRIGCAGICLGGGEATAVVLERLA